MSLNRAWSPDITDSERVSEREQEMGKAWADKCWQMQALSRGVEHLAGMSPTVPAGVKTAWQTETETETVGVSAITQQFC